jgi:DNA modification methylase
MLRTFSRTTRVSNFRPTAAKAIYERYSDEGDKVLDFSAGYGGRLLGCLSLRRHFIGIDPCSKQIQGLNRMNERLQKIVDTDASVEIHRACAEDFLPAIRKHSIDLVFSSPPYFNLERYSKETSQSYIRYPTYADWRQEFFRRLITQSHRVLKPEGLFVINVANVNGFPLVEDLHSFVAGLFRQIGTLQLRLGHKPYLKRLNGTVHKYEPVFVFRKKHQRK